MNLADENLQTALHMAIKRGLSRFFPSSDIVEMLIKNGANIELRDKDEKTALDLASKSGCEWNSFR